MFARNRCFHFFISQSMLDHELLGRIGGYEDASAQLAVDLHRDLDLFFFGERGVILRPWCMQETSLLSQHLPEFVSQIRRKGRQQQHDVALHLRQERHWDGFPGNCIFRAVQNVYQLHDRRDAGVEVPAPLEIVADAFDGLMQFTLDGACVRRQL